MGLNSTTEYVAHKNQRRYEDPSLGFDDLYVWAIFGSAHHMVEVRFCSSQSDWFAIYSNISSPTQHSMCVCPKIVLDDFGDDL